MRAAPAIGALAGIAIAGAAAAGCGGSGDPTTISVGVPAVTSTAAPPSGAQGATTTSGPAGGSTPGSGPRPAPGSGIAARTPIEAASAVLTTAGSAAQACGAFVTARFVEVSFGGGRNCVAARAGEALAGEISVASGAGPGSTHLVVIPAGGPYDGARVEVELVAAGGGFRVDSLNAHVPAGP